MAGGFSFFWQKSSFDRNSQPKLTKTNTRKDGKLDEKQMTFFLEEALGLEYEQAQIYIFLVDNSYEF